MADKKPTSNPISDEEFPKSIYNPAIRIELRHINTSREQIERLIDRIWEELKDSGFFQLAPTGTDLKLCEQMYRLGAG